MSIFFRANDCVCDSCSYSYASWIDSTERTKTLRPCDLSTSSLSEVMTHRNSLGMGCCIIAVSMSRLAIDRLSDTHD